MTDTVSVLALVTDAYGGRGGIAQYNRDFLRALSESDAVSQIAVLPRHCPDRPDPPTKIAQTRARAGRVAYALAALAAAFTRQIDVVFCGHLYMAPLAALIARLRGASLIVQMHGVEAWARPTTLQRLAVESADLILCVSRYTRAAVLVWAAIAPERVAVLPNTVAKRFSPGDSAAFRSAHGLKGKRVLLTVGRIAASERYKGHDRVIQCLPDLVKRGHDVAYLIAGEGNDQARLEDLARTLDVADRVQFLGQVPEDMLVRAYRSADLFVMPSTGEGFGIAFLEAMASGTPALGLAVAGANDALADGELGTGEAVADVGAGIARLLARSKPDPQALAAAVKARFGGEAFASGVEARIQRLLSTPVSPRTA